jgi:hypothetical protein
MPASDGAILIIAAVALLSGCARHASDSETIFRPVLRTEPDKPGAQQLGCADGKHRNRVPTDQRCPKWD